MSRFDDPELARVTTAEALATSLNNDGIRYVLVNGLYGYPSGIGRDIDILIRPDDAPKAIAYAEQTRILFGWDSLLLRWSPYGTWQLYFVREGTAKLSWLEVDLMHSDTMLLGAASFVDNFSGLIDSPDQFRGPFPVSRVGYYIKAQLRPILYGDLARFENKYALEAVEDQSIKEYLQHLIGPRMADRYCKASHAGVQGMRHLGRRLKWAINRYYAFRHPLLALRNGLWSRIVRPARLYLFSAGLAFAVVGPDYAEKKAALEEAVKYLNGCFEVRIREFCPELGSSLRINPDQSPPGWILHWLQILRHFVRLIVECLTHGRFLPKSVIQFVVYDGSTLNLAINPARYGLRSGAGTRSLRRFVSRPVEIVLLEDAQANVPAQSACGSHRPIDAELAKWHELVETGQVKHTVTVGDTAVVTGRRLASSMLREIERRFKVSQSEPLRRAKLKRGLSVII